MSAALATWLAQPVDFSAGVALYAQLGGSSVYQQLFALGETGYSRDVLVRELRALVPAPEQPQRLPYVPRVAPAPEHEFVVEPIVVPAPPAVNEAALQQVRAQLKARRDERDQLRAQLTAPGLRKSHRNTMAHRICELTDQVYELQEAEAHVLAHGRLPGPISLAQLVDPGELRRRLKTLITHRSKARKDPARAGELPGLEADIRLIREKLNIPQRD